MRGGAPGQKVLSQLVGQPWLDAGREGDKAWFHFGGTRQAAAFALHVQIPWRLTGPSGMMIGSGDQATQEDFADFRRAAAASPMVVSAVVADRHQGFAVVLSGGCRLDVFADTHAERELWRMLVPADATTPHAIARPSGMGLE